MLMAYVHKMMQFMMSQSCLGNFQRILTLNRQVFIGTPCSSSSSSDESDLGGAITAVSAMAFLSITVASKLNIVYKYSS